MKNIFLFLWKNHFTFLFVLLQILCFYLIIQNNRYHNAAWFNTSQKAAGRILALVNSLVQYVNLKSSNEKLAEENARLRTQMAALLHDTIPAYPLTDTVGKYVFLPAQVVNNSFTRRNNYLTIDRGLLHGLRPEMGVIGSQGIVGMIKDVSTHYATVMSLLHKDFRTSAGFKNSGYFGSLSWPGMNPTLALLSDIPQHVKFSVGDTIITTGYSTLFPKGIMIGTVHDFESPQGSSFYRIRIRLSTDFAKLSWVYVVDNRHGQEIDELEHKIFQLP